MKHLLLTFHFLQLLNSGLSQDVLILGNSESIVLKEVENVSYTIQSEIPKELDSFDCIFIFSTAKNTYSETQFQQLLNYVSRGKGLYCGAENYPLNAEFDQFLNLLTGQVSYGKYDCKQASFDQQSNLKHENLEEVASGNSIVSFPLDHRMQVDLWVNDQPLVASMNYENGRIVLDGGYSRFYSGNSDDVNQLWISIVKYLSGSDNTH